MRTWPEVLRFELSSPANTFYGKCARRSCVGGNPSTTLPQPVMADGLICEARGRADFENKVASPEPCLGTPPAK